jgi:hypothetical protein
MPAEVGETLARFQAWRQARRSGARIPKALWGEAVALARRLGVNLVATALGVNHTALKERLSSSSGPPQLPATVTPTFVELATGPLLEPNEAGASLEVTASDGARMVLRMPAGSAFDLAGLLTSFLGRRLAQQGSLK